MIIDTISYTERKNFGNYEHGELTATAKIEEGENKDICVHNLIQFVRGALQGKQEIKEEVKVEEVVKEEPKTEEVKVEEVKAPAKKTKAKKVKEEVKEEVVVEEVKAPKSTNIPYDRNQDTHRQLLSSFLTKNYPSWKTKEGIKEFSASLVGKEFLDAEGNILESFKKEISGFFA